MLDGKKEVAKKKLIEANATHFSYICEIKVRKTLVCERVQKNGQI